MSLSELFFLAVGLSMDAFAVSMCKGMALKTPSLKACLTAGVFFGGFQAGMPLLGYILGSSFADLIAAVDHWIAFALLVLIGANMIRESFRPDEETDPDMSLRTMTLLAVATSIDALAVGVSLAFLDVAIIPSVCFIGAVTFAFSAFGVWLGGKLVGGRKINAELVGGIVLIVIGGKILLEHLGVI